MVTCGLGRVEKGTVTLPFIVLGGAALGLAAVALVTGSLTPLSLLVLTIVVLWALATARHMRQAPPRPTAA